MQGQQHAMNALLLQQAQLGASQGIRLLVPGGQLAAAAAAAAAAARPGGTNPAAFRGQALNMGMMIKTPARKSGGNQKGRKHCNCKNSRCLKLYCECFASGRYCDNCNCLNCFNNKDSEAVRQSAVESILERNPNAFRPKIQTAEGDTHPQSIRNAPDGTVRHTKGCNCKKSSCLKKYCECFQGGIFCTEICKCVECKNYDGSEARAQVLTLADPYNHPQQLHQQLHQAAAAQQAAALKRQRMQSLQQPMLQQQAAAPGLLAQNAALQQLAAAAAAAAASSAPPGPPALQLSVPLPAAAPGAVPAAAATATPQPASPSALPQRSPLLDVVHDLVNPVMIEELCQLLLLVAKDEADKQQGQGQQQEQAAGSAAVTAAGIAATASSKPATANGGGGAAAAAAEAEQPLQKRIKLEPGDADGNSAAAATEQQQQKQAVKQQQQGDSGVSALYAAQEAAVLSEFNAFLKRISVHAEKKAGSLASSSLLQPPAPAAAADHGSADAAAMPVTAAAAADHATSTDGMANGVDGSHQADQQLQQQPVAMQLAQQAAMWPPSMQQQQQLSQQQQALLAMAAQLQQQANRQQLAALSAGSLGAAGLQLHGVPLSLGMLQQLQAQSLMLPGMAQPVDPAAASQAMLLQQQQDGGLTMSLLSSLEPLQAAAAGMPAVAAEQEQVAQ